jgi:YHS domain-containing protein
VIIGWLLRLLVIVLLIRAVWGFLRGLAQGAAGAPPIGRGGPREPSPVQLVKDPVCGTYVPRSRALEATAGGETRQFCSETCRSTWLKDRGRRSA